MSHMYIESNNNKAYSLEYVACVDEDKDKEKDKDKALKNPKHLFKICNCVESVTTSQGSMDGQNNGEKLVKNCTPTTWIWNGCNIPSHSHIIYYFNCLTFNIFLSLTFFIII